MRLNKILSLVPVVALVLVASAPASAQRGKLGLGMSKVGKNASIGIGNGIRNPGKAVIGDAIKVKPGKIVNPIGPRPGIIVDPIPPRRPGIIVDPIPPRPGIIVDPIPPRRPGIIIDPFPIRCWVPGHWETVCEQVWIPGCGCERQVWVEPVYETVCDPCCGERQVLVTAGYYKTVVEAAGHFETRTRQVWVSGFYR